MSRTEHAAKEGASLPPKTKRIVFKNGSSITFKPFSAGKERFQGAKVDYILFEDGPEFYRWWQMPLYWWRVLVQAVSK